MPVYHHCRRRITDNFPVRPDRLKKAGRNSTDWGIQGVKRSLMTDTNGLPLSLVVAGANTYDIKLVADTPDALQTGRPGRKLRLFMDKGYEAEWLKTVVTDLISSQGKRRRKL